MNSKPSYLSLNQADVAACMKALQPVNSVAGLRTWRAPARFLHKLAVVIHSMKAKSPPYHKSEHKGRGWSTAEKLAYAIAHDPTPGRPYWTEHELAILNLLLARETL